MGIPFHVLLLKAHVNIYVASIGYRLLLGIFTCTSALSTRDIFIIFFSLGVDRPAVILGNQTIINHVLEHARTFFVDGTFRITPRLAKPSVLNLRGSQVVNILGDVNGHHIPVFHIVMCTKKVIFN